MPDFPVDIFDQHTAIIGRTGSGKSFAARGIVERWLEQGRRVCVVDPTDVWFGLRSNANGDGPGFPVAIIGGDHGDVGISERSGERIAEIIATRNLPAVIVTAEMTGGERHRFMTDFLGTLYRRNHAPLHLVLDEADDVAPQNPLPENRRMLGDVDRIVRRGRVRGFRVMLITQRPAVLNKNVLSQASTLIAMRLPAPQDRKAVEEWIKGQADIDQAREVLTSLSRLNRGEGWVWAPDRAVLTRATFPLIRTFDSMRTPEHGEMIGAPTTLAPVELGDLQALMTPAPPEQAADPVASDPGAFAAAERQGHERGLAEGRRLERAEQIEQRREMEAAVQAALGYLAPFAKLEDGAPVIDVRRPAPPIAIEAEPIPAALAARRRRSASSEQTPPAAAPAALHAAARRLLIASAQHAPARFTWGQFATLAGLKPSGGHFNAGRKELRDRELVIEDGGLVAITDAGIAAAGTDVPPAPSTPVERLNLWCSRLPSPAPEMLRALAANGGYVNADDLAARLGKKPTGGHWNSGIATLRQNGLIEADGRRYRIAELFRDG